MQVKRLFAHCEDFAGRLLHNLVTEEQQIDRPRGGLDVIRRITGLAATALLSGAMGLTALGLGAGIAQAGPTWCPGDPVPGGFAPEAVAWNWDVCHEYNLRIRGNPPEVWAIEADDGGWRRVAGPPAMCGIFGCINP